MFEYQCIGQRFGRREYEDLYLPKRLFGDERHDDMFGRNLERQLSDVHDLRLQFGAFLHQCDRKRQRHIHRRYSNIQL